MIRWNTLKAMIVGIAILVLAQVVYVFELLRIENHGLIRLALLGFPGLAAFTAAYLSPHRKIASGMSMAVFGAVIGMAAAAVYEQLGLHVDSIGSPAATFAILLAYNSILCIVGSAAGYYLS